MVIKEMKMQQSIIDDEFWTPIELYEKLCNKYDIHPQLDAAANEQNKKCDEFLTNALFEEWVLKNKTIVDIWCNPPHSKTEYFIRRANSQHRKYNMNILMIIPSNTESTQVYQEIIEDELKQKVENHPMERRPRFLKHGFTKTKFSSRNSYRIIIWRKREKSILKLLHHCKKHLEHESNCKKCIWWAKNGKCQHEKPFDRDMVYSSVLKFYINKGYSIEFSNFKAREVVEREILNRGLKHV